MAAKEIIITTAIWGTKNTVANPLPYDESNMAFPQNNKSNRTVIGINNQVNFRFRKYKVKREIIGGTKNINIKNPLITTILSYYNLTLKI